MEDFGAKFNLQVDPVFLFEDAPSWYWQKIKQIEAKFDEDEWYKLVWDNSLDSNRDLKNMMKQMATQISPGPLEAGQCQTCQKNDQEEEYWILWKEGESQEYMCTKCQKEFRNWAHGADGAAWVAACANHDREESHKLWEQLHDLLEDKLGVDMKEEHGEHVVRQVQDTASHCCHAQG